ncbi:MAG: DUF1549 domain-containing protein, partial [Planctomycetota bacterium]
MSLTPILCAANDDVPADDPATSDDTATPEFTSDQIEFFETQVRPLLAGKCGGCHSQAVEKTESGLSLDTRQHVLRGGDSGPAVDLDDIDDSLLLQVISYDAGLDMPPEEPLSIQQRDVLRRWVEMGLPWPREDAGAAPHGFNLEQRVRRHWAWQPIQSPAIPALESDQWSRSGIDRFVLQQLRDVDLPPVDDARRGQLLRRLHMDLVGLLPSADETKRFLKDERPDALERVVDRLLADPEFGVRWGRHWLDLVRYAETYGHEFDYAIPHAWAYRDWVINAINDDLPFDDFATEQLAGDQLPTPRRDRIDGRNLSKYGTAFWWLGDSVHAPVDSAADQATRVDNQIDVATKSFLGLTVSCARCHDHKFDAISQADYTAIAGLLHATYRVKSYADPGGKRARNRSALNGAADALLNALSVETTASDPTITPPTTAVVVPPRPLDNAQQPRPKQPYALFDFTLGRPDGSVTDGDAFQNPGGQPRAIALHASADGAFHAAPAGWLDSRRSGTAAVGTYHSPPFRIEENRLAIRYVGSGNVRIRLVVDGYYMTDYHNLLFGDTMIRADSKGKWKQHIIAGRLKDYVGRVAHLEVI